MAYIESNFFPLKVYVRNEYMYQNQKGHGEFTEGVIVSVRCMPDSNLLFQVLLDNGVLRDKLPPHALLTKPELPKPDLAFHYLQLWNCFSYNFTVIKLGYLSSSRVDVYMKDHKWYPGVYFATVNWGANDMNCDITLSEDPMEHKSHHIILLDNNQIAVQPNNRIRWYEPSFVTEKFPSKPDYLVCKDEYNSELHEKWHTENSDRMFYDNE
jgi:hypothetical protein